MNATEPAPDSGALRVLLQQSAMPRFRVPFYRELAARPGIDLEVLYGTKALPNEQAPDLRAEHREVRRLPGGLYWDGVHLDRLRAGRFEAASLIWNIRYASLVPAIMTARRQGAGVVLWGHGYSKQEAGVRAWTRARIATMADAIVLYSDAVARRYVDDWGMPADRVFVARNAIDQGPVQQARASLGARDLADFRRREGLADGPVLLFVSRLYRENRVDLLLDAVAHLRDGLPATQVVIVGTGPDEASLRNHADALGVADRVRFLGAIYDEQRLAPWFLSSTAFVYPQNIGLSLLHAFGYGLPVITSDHRDTQNPEIEALRHGENGLECRHGSARDLAEAVARLVTEPGLRERLSREAHRTAVEDYTISRMADGMEAALRFAAQRAVSRRTARSGSR